MNIFKEKSISLEKFIFDTINLLRYCRVYQNMIDEKCNKTLIIVWFESNKNKENIINILSSNTEIIEKWIENNKWKYAFLQNF